MKKKAILMTAVLMVSGTVCFGAAGDFDFRGRSSFSWEQDRMFEGEDYELFEAGNSKNSDVIDWRCTATPQPPNECVTLVSVGGKFSTKNSVEHIPGGFKMTFDITVKNPSPEGNAVGMGLVIPKATFSSIPMKENRLIGEAGKDGKLAVKTRFHEYDLQITGDGSVQLEKALVTDFRKMDWADYFRLDIKTAPFKGGHAKITLQATRKTNPDFPTPGPDSAFKVISLKNYYTRPLTDELENDGKGGWTDQGSNDMSMLKPGIIQAQAVPFEIGDGAIILRGAARQSFPQKSKVIPVNERVERLAFCHTCAWCKPMEESFVYRITYGDNTKVDVPVYGNLDVADWAGPLPATARVKCAWTSGNNEHQVHLAHFQWKNPEPKKIVKSVQVLSANKTAVAAVLAITAVRLNKTDDALITVLNNEFNRVNTDSFIFTKEKPDWYEGGLDAGQTIVPDSALDVSFLLDAPAGKYGFVKRVGNHFEFEKCPGKRIAFWGTCLQTAGPRREFIPVIVDRLKKSGINIVRIHMWLLAFYPEGEEGARSFIRQDGTVNMQRLDDFYYFFSELKKNGIYIYMDNAHTFNEWLPGGNGLHYRKDANDRIKEISKLMFTTVNPYTGLRLVDDPAFAMMEIHNEFSAGYEGSVEGHSPEAQKNMQERWAKWKKDHNIDDPAPLKGGPVEGNGEEGRRFYTNVQKEFLEDWYKYLRELGVRVPISGTNLLLTAGDLVSSQNMDFMEDHSYFGAVPPGSGTWVPLDTATLHGSISGNSMMGEILHSRLYDKPIVCTEWSDVYPNPYRMEGYPLFGAYAAYQAVDGMFSFDWSGGYLANISDVVNHGPIVCLSQISDPCTWGLNQATAIAFLRQDITPAKNKVVLKYTYDDIWQNRRQNPLTVSWLFQMAQVSIKVQKDRNAKPEWPLETGMKPEELYKDSAKRLKIDIGRDYLVSDTKELIRFIEPGLFIVNTPKSQWATGALTSLGKGPLRKLSAFDVNSSMDFATITFTSLDNEPLKTSSRILLCAIGKAANAGCYYDAYGYHESRACPILCEPFYASVSAKAVPGKTLKVFKLDPSTGKRLGELAVKSEKGKESFNLDKETKTMYLELVRE